MTVAVIDSKQLKEVVFNERAFKIEWYSGTGGGGQNRNKIQASCRLTHLPTDTIQTAQTRSRENSFKLALEEILKRLNSSLKNAESESVNYIRSSQIGSGMRGDKRRTYRFQDDKVTDHVTMKTARLQDVMNGKFDLLW